MAVSEGSVTHWIVLLRAGDPAAAEARAVALWKMEGYTSEEIAQKLGCVGRTAERKLRALCGLWEKETVA
jgi:hypothetical protein